MSGRAIWLAIATCAALASPVRAQQGPTAEQAIQREREVFGPPSPQPRCGSGGPDEIVVCAPESSDQYRVPSTADSDPSSREARRRLNDGIPRAPQVGTVIDCSTGGCIGFGSVPPPAYIVDFSQIPEAPAGSDAERIAKGEAPAP